MKEEPLSLAHRETIVDLCAHMQLPISEYNFCNLYVFRKAHQYTVVEYKKEKAIKGISYQGKPFLMPLSHPLDPSAIVSWARDMGVKYLFPIPEAWWESFQGYSIQTVDDDADYLYETASLASCQGRNLSSHRNMVRQLLDTYDITIKPYQPEHMEEALSIVQTWADEKEITASDADIKPFGEAIELASTLDLQGWMFYVDGAPAGCMFGQALTKNTYVLHFSKSLMRYRGLTRFMRQYSAKAVSEKFPYINWEQDLGIEGLRRFKRSYLSLIHI